MKSLDLLDEFRAAISQLAKQIEAADTMKTYDIRKVSGSLIVGVVRGIHGWRHLRDLNSTECLNFLGIDPIDEVVDGAIQLIGMPAPDQLKSIVGASTKHGLDTKCQLGDVFALAAHFDRGDLVGNVKQARAVAAAPEHGKDTQPQARLRGLATGYKRHQMEQPWRGGLVCRPYERMRAFCSVADTSRCLGMRGLLTEQDRVSSATVRLFRRQSLIDTACCSVDRGRGKHRDQTWQKSMPQVEIVAVVKSHMNEATACLESLGDSDQDVVLGHEFAEADLW